MGQQAGRKVLTVQTIPAWEEDDCGTGQLGRVGGFAGVPVGASNSLWASHCSRFTDENSLVKLFCAWLLGGGR